MDNGELSGVIFLEIRKAFNSINYVLLLQKMRSQFGITDKELEWFSSYLTNREQICTVNGNISLPKKITYGVPQGSILGVFYFCCTLMIWKTVLIKQRFAYMQMILKYFRPRLI